VQLVHKDQVGQLVLKVRKDQVGQLVLKVRKDQVVQQVRKVHQVVEPLVLKVQREQQELVVQMEMLVQQDPKDQQVLLD
jgi:hypothetical protein